MADLKRIQLDTAKPLQRDKKNKDVQPTVRFKLALDVSSDTGCTEFSFAELMKDSRNANREKNHSEDPFEDDENDDKLQELARKLEEKYNPKPGRRKKNKVGFCEDYVDRGMGYDETDPFIDNEEAYDELVPSTLTTEFGGFYINKGDLEFRNASESESCADIKLRKKRRKQVFDKDSKKKRRLTNDEENPKRRGRKPANEIVSALPKIKKKTQPTVADMLQHHKAQLQLQEQEKKLQQLHLTPITVEREVEPEVNNGSAQTIQLGQGLNSSISEAIESVVKAAAEDAVSNGSFEPPTGSSDCEENVKPPIENIEAPKLPDNLPPDLDTLVAKLKQAAYNSEEGKCKFFSDEVNRMLLSVELKSQELTSAQRSTIYSHLASHLPCTKETLQKRAKKLRLDQEDGKLREPMQKLKDGIAAVMPEMIEKYTAMLNVTDSKEEVKKGDNALLPASEEDSQEEEKKSRLPKKRFEWNDTIRKYLCDVVRIKLKCYEVSKTRIQSAEEYLKHFLEAEVKNLWPVGWMQSRILFRESRTAHFYITNRQKKPLVLPKKSTVMIAMKPAVSILNPAVLSQDSDFETFTQIDKCVPSHLTLSIEEVAERKESIDVPKPTCAVPVDSDINQSELSKLFTYPIKTNITEAFYSSHHADEGNHFPDTKSELESLAKSVLPLSKAKHELCVPVKTNCNLQPLRTTEQTGISHSQSKQPVLSPGKIPEVNTFTEASLASDMLARIICASLADFPYAGSSNADTMSTKTQSVITSSSSLIHGKDSRIVNSKFPADILTSQKKFESGKSFNVENRKPSHETGPLGLLSGSIDIESLRNAHHSVRQSEIPVSSLIIKSKGISPETGKSPVNLKLKDVIVPQSRQFAEAFERAAESPMLSRKHVKGHNLHLQNLAVSSVNASIRFSNANELLNESTVNVSPRTVIDSSPRMSQDLIAKFNTPVTTQGPSTAPYKKRTKYAQQTSKNSSDQWNHYLEAGIGASLLEGMKGFPFPVSTLPTPPPAHCSAPHKATPQLKDSNYVLHSQHNQRAGSHLSSGPRLIPDTRTESSNHSQQGHVRLPVVEGSRRQSLIQGPWNKNPTSQTSSTSHSLYLASSSSISNPKSTSPNQHSSTSHQNPTPVYAHSHSTPQPETSAYSHSQLPLRVSPSQVQGHSSKTSSNVYSQQVSQTFLARQSSHSVSGHQPQVLARSNSSFEHTHPSATTTNSLTGTFTLSQEQKATHPRN